MSTLAVTPSHDDTGDVLSDIEKAFDRVTLADVVHYISPDGEKLIMPDAKRVAPDPDKPSHRLKGTPRWEGPVHDLQFRQRDPWPFMTGRGYVLSAQLVLANTVGQPDGCWFWRGATYTGEQPRTTYHVMGRGELVQRVCYAAYYGPVPCNMAVTLVCGDPACCNPAHMMLKPAKRRSQARALDAPPLDGDTLARVTALYDKHRRTVARNRRRVRESVDRPVIASPYRDGRKQARHCKA